MTHPQPPSMPPTRKQKEWGPVLVGYKPVSERMITRLAKATLSKVFPSFFIGGFVGLINVGVAGHDPVAIGWRVLLCTEALLPCVRAQKNQSRI